MAVKAEKQKRAVWRKAPGRFFAVMAAVLCLVSVPAQAAGTWPASQEEIKAGGAVLMDVDTGTVLYEKNMHVQYCPASVTKLMTALLVLENCRMDEEVIFTPEAVENLESGAVTIEAVEGDCLTVKDCLYALLFKSANDVANALAIHVSGSVESFAQLMNQRAARLGCRETSFRNPSGLTDPEHLTSAYDMALIGAACMEKPDFIQIESQDSYRLGPTRKYPEGLKVTVGHKMLREGTPYSDDRVVGGKTGYILASGNTLVTMAVNETAGGAPALIENGGNPAASGTASGEETGGQVREVPVGEEGQKDSGEPVRRLVCVCLKEKSPDHYTDTKALLDFGFSGFKQMDVSFLLEKPELEEKLERDQILPEVFHTFVSDRKMLATVPFGAAKEDISFQMDYNLSEEAPSDSIAKLIFLYGSYPAGFCYIAGEAESALVMEEMDEPEGLNTSGGNSLHKSQSLSLTILAGVCGAVGAGLIIFARSAAKRRQKEKERRRQAVCRRNERLKDMDMTAEEFEQKMKEHRAGHEK